MWSARITAGLAGLMLSVYPLIAQQPGHQPMGAECGMMADSAMMRSWMHTRDSLDTRLDSAVSRMNRATAETRMDRMVDVINELAAHRRVMREHMHQHMRGMMHSPGGRRRSEHGRERWRPGSAQDTIHHSPK